jgi:predicted metalloendopeptidase
VLSAALAKAHLYSVEALFKPVVSHDRGLTGRTSLFLSQGGWSLGKANYASEQLVANFTSAIARVLPLLTPLNASVANQVAKEIVNLEYRLANASVQQ